MHRDCPREYYPQMLHVYTFGLLLRDWPRWLTQRNPYQIDKHVRAMRSFTGRRHEDGDGARQWVSEKDEDEELKGLRICGARAH